MKMILKGYVAQFPNDSQKYYSPATNNKSAFCTLKINVPYSTTVKNEQTGQYEKTKKSDLINLMANGKSADLLNQFQAKQEIVCMAEFNGIQCYINNEGKQLLSIDAFLTELYTFADSINSSNIEPVNKIPEPSFANQPPQMNNAPEPLNIPPTSLNLNNQSMQQPPMQQPPQFGNFNNRIDRRDRR